MPRFKLELPGRMCVLWWGLNRALNTEGRRMDSWGGTLWRLFSSDCFRGTRDCAAGSHGPARELTLFVTHKATTSEWRMLPRQAEQGGSRETFGEGWGLSGSREHNVSWSVCAERTTGWSGKAPPLGGPWRQGKPVFSLHVTLCVYTSYSVEVILCIHMFYV